VSGRPAVPGLDPGAAGPDGLVHGMGRELVAPDWPPLTDDEVRIVLAAYPARGDGRPDGQPVVTWRSPRPMSAAGLVRYAGDGRRGMSVFVKRHHRAVRSTAQLVTEHALATYLRLRGIAVPAVLRDADGATVTEHGDFRYEVHEVADGVDLYRDAVSWSPFTSSGHAWAAGAALARLHDAAAAFPLPERPPAPLLSSCAVVAAAPAPGPGVPAPGVPVPSRPSGTVGLSSPAGAVARFAAELPALTAYLGTRDWRADVDQYLGPPIERAAPLLAALPRQWGHGDWHPSNLTWTGPRPDAVVAGVLDLSLANRTLAVHDLATALERATVSWLDLDQTGHATADLDAVDALLDGYESIRPLSDLEVAALAAVLPVVHVEYALTEVEYFAGIVASPANADLAYDAYLLGHARWFAGPEGAVMLNRVRRRPALPAVVPGPPGADVKARPRIAATRQGRRSGARLRRARPPRRA
jgi:Ser/Thr protein kinase RdoA (MazF antagonist)